MHILGGRRQGIKYFHPYHSREGLDGVLDSPAGRVLAVRGILVMKQQLGALSISLCACFPNEMRNNQNHKKTFDKKSCPVTRVCMFRIGYILFKLRVCNIVTNTEPANKKLWLLEEIQARFSEPLVVFLAVDQYIIFL